MLEIFMAVKIHVVFWVITSHHYMVS